MFNFCDSEVVNHIKLKFDFAAVYIMIALSDTLDWTNGEKGTVLVFALSMSYANIIVNPLIWWFSPGPLVSSTNKTPSNKQTIYHK
jgi:hypothetical protein